MIKDMNGKDYFPLGVDYAWKDWGRDFNSKGWDVRFKSFEADFDAMQARGVRTLRWWIYTDFIEAPLWSGKGKDLRCTGMPENWVANFMKAAEAAQKRGIRLYPVFSSFDLGLHGFREVVRNPETRKSFIENAVRPILKAAGTSEAIFAWDVINEPEWLVQEKDNGAPNKNLTDGPVSLQELRDYIREMAAEIHASAKQPVSVGSAGLKWSGLQFDFFSGLKLDFFDVHYYDWMTPYFDITLTPKSSLSKNAEYRNKPMMIGECIPKPLTQYTGKNKPLDHTGFLRAIRKMGYCGYLPWAWNEKPVLDVREELKNHLLDAAKEMKL
jgi:hypothetical protein